MLPYLKDKPIKNFNMYELFCFVRKRHRKRVMTFISKDNFSPRQFEYIRQYTALKTMRKYP